MGLTEVAAHFGISKSYARKLSERRDWPEGTKLLQGWVWDGLDVEQWWNEHPHIGRRPTEGEPDAGPATTSG